MNTLRPNSEVWLHPLDRGQKQVHVLRTWILTSGEGAVFVRLFLARNVRGVGGAG